MFLHIHTEDIKKYYKRLFGILSAVLSYFLFALSNILTKFVSNMTMGEVMCVRQFVIFIIAIVYFSITKEIFEIYKTSRLSTHFWRGFYGYANSYLTLVAMLFLPVAESSSLSYTHGIFMVFLTPLFLKDKVSAMLALYVLIGFVGVIFIANPSNGAFNIKGCFCGLLAGLLMAFSVLYVKLLSSTESIKTTLFYFAIITFLLSLIPLLFETSGSWSSSDIWYSIWVGLAGAAGQVFLTISIFCVSPTTTAVISYSSMIWTTVLGYLIWNEIPGINFYIGSALIIYAGIASTIHKLKSSRIRV